MEIESSSGVCVFVYVVGLLLVVFTFASDHLFPPLSPPTVCFSSQFGYYDKNMDIVDCLDQQVS